MTLNYDNKQQLPNIKPSSQVITLNHHQFSLQPNVPIAPELRALAVAHIEPKLRLLQSLEVIQKVQSTAKLELQQFFIEQDQSFKNGEPVKPVFFSPEYQQLVISIPDLDLYLERYSQQWETEPTRVSRALEEFAYSRVEFALHEYGHIAAINKAIVIDPAQKAELWQKRQQLEQMIKQWPHAHLALQRLTHVQSDLRAEVFRRDLRPEFDRRTEIFAKYGVQDRVIDSGVYKSPTLSPDSILRMLIWLPVCPALGPKDYRDLVIKQITKECRSYLPSLENFFIYAADYFDQYYSARSYDQEQFIKQLS